MYVVGVGKNEIQTVKNEPTVLIMHNVTTLKEVWERKGLT